MPVKKKRPGHQASFTLVALDDPKTWERVERHGEEVLESIANLTEYERSLEEMGPSKECFTKDELKKIVSWKHSVGKNRVYNLKHLEQNSDDAVQEHSRAAISLALKIKPEECLTADGSLNATGKKSIQDVIACMDKLKGVGPATASAALVLVRPDFFCYLYDEVIDCFETQRDYKIANYLRVNSRCLQIAHKLGVGWTPSRVAKAIWIAARYLALYDEDLSKYEQSLTDQIDEGGDEGENEDDKVIKGNVEGESKQPAPKRQKSESV